ncbi:hypothetical protein LTR62_007380 [Meristemomyces frigidus]|uniref:MutL C-terminal dimerisation domain-containing protein n=1 Tax=Meristemomyces frigidus TaxID=1508187 RepID=A0AAN7YRK3_9PEZI|nr:hypothetical protein LTR62_007380 [Meristemomyces frigidus]
MSRILPLPTDAAAQIYSSKTITSLQGVVLALLENSLDAGATKVEISIDFDRGGCTVLDNGAGILSEEFNEEGGLGKMFYTSKRSRGIEAGELHGTNGIYLASLAALCLLSITSKHQECTHHATLIMRSGRTIARHRPGLLSDELNTSSGTQVCVRDLFGSMPVRVKQRTLARDNGLEVMKSWQGLKHGLTALLVSWHRPCTVRCKDAKGDAGSLVLCPTSTTAGKMLTERSLSSLTGRAVGYGLQDTLLLLCQAGLLAAESRHRFESITASTTELSVKALFCLDPAPMKQCQFISIGINPVSAISGHNELYSSINQVFSNSSFGATDEPEVLKSEHDRRKHDRRFKNNGYTQKQLHGRKGVDRWPSYVLKVTINDGSALKTPDSISDQSLKAIDDLLKAMATRWLHAHNFRPQKLRKKNPADQGSPTALLNSPRRSSTADGVRGRRSDLLATPSIKRAATATSASTSKKPRTGAFPTSQASAVRASDFSTYFDGLTRIKSGRPPTGRTQTVPTTPKPLCPEGSRTSTPKLPFSMPKLMPAPFSETPTAASRGLGRDVVMASGVENTKSATRLANSDDYGSIDDDTLLEVATAMADAPTPDPLGRDTIESLDDKIVDWLDSRTKQVYRVNARTGVVLPAPPRVDKQISNLGSKAAIDTTTTAAGGALSLARRSKSTASSSTVQWLPGFLAQWDNPVFHRQGDQRIPVASFDGPGFGAAEAALHRCADHSLTQHFTEDGIKSSKHLSKKALANIRIIKQVDKKFILCLMPSSEDGESQHKRILVLVDQHAASERVILENLFTQLFSPIDASSPMASYTTNLGYRSSVATVLLEKPQRFQVSEKEAKLFVQHAHHFADWGILYEIITVLNDAKSQQSRALPLEQALVTVVALPTGIAERCILLPHILIELLRTEIWEPTSAREVPQETTDNDAREDGWLRRIGTCPNGIIAHLKSRACRSAIMFNDSLGVEDCERLLHDLSLCHFPFICAHGRVSMVPLMELDGESGDGMSGAVDGNNDRDRQSFSKAFTCWKKESCVTNQTSQSTFGMLCDTGGVGANV